jgi:WD40 repeat protein
MAKVFTARKSEEGGIMKKINNTKINRFIRFTSTLDLQTSIKKAALCCITAFIILNVMTFTGGCFAMLEEKDTISNLSFSHDGKSVVFDRCQNEGCQIQVYNLETGKLAAYQSPKNERWTMGKYSYDGKKITFSVIPIKFTGSLDLGEMQIAVMDADGKNYKKVTTGPGAKLYPAFSHNGKKILYARAARIRESGKTPAADYDAWEVNLDNGKQTQLTFFEYFYMGYLTYFPDDERFIYYGDRPVKYGDISWHKDEKAFVKLVKESEAQGKKFYDVVVMKGKELIKNPYVFPEKTFPQKPLLSKDGTVLIYEKSHSGKFYLYSPDGNHRYLSGGGSINNAAIAPDGNLLAMISVGLTIDIYATRDGNALWCLYLPCTPKKIENWNIRPEFKHIYKMIPENPARIINQ